MKVIIKGYQLKEKRKKLGLTLKKVASYCQVSEGYLSRIENGSSIPSLDLLRKISNLYEWNLNELVEIEENLINESPNKIAIETLFKGQYVLTHQNKVLSPKDKLVLQQCLTILTRNDNSLSKKVFLSLLETLTQEGE